MCTRRRIAKTTNRRGRYNSVIDHINSSAPKYDTRYTSDIKHYQDDISRESTCTYPENEIKTMIPVPDIIIPNTMPSNYIPITSTFCLPVYRGTVMSCSMDVGNVITDDAILTRTREGYRYVTDITSKLFHINNNNVLDLVEQVGSYIMIDEADSMVYQCCPPSSPNAIVPSAIGLIIDRRTGDVIAPDNYRNKLIVIFNIASIRT